MIKTNINFDKKNISASEKYNVEDVKSDLNILIDKCLEGDFE